MRENLKAILLKFLQEYVPNFKLLYSTMSDELPLYGISGLLDSIELVTLIVTFEYELEIMLNRPFSISTDKTVSLSNSPFRTINSFLDYLESITK